MACCTATWSGMKLEHCNACCQTFTTTRNGDAHRVGDHAVSSGPNRRRCLSVEEMRAIGLVQNVHGHWMQGRETPVEGATSLPRNA